MSFDTDKDRPLSAFGERPHEFPKLPILSPAEIPPPREKPAREVWWTVLPGDRRDRALVRHGQLVCLWFLEPA